MAPTLQRYYIYHQTNMITVSFWLQVLDPPVSSSTSPLFVKSDTVSFFSLHIYFLLSLMAFKQQFLLSAWWAHEPHESRDSGSFSHVCVSGIYSSAWNIGVQEICQKHRMNEWKNRYLLLNLKIFESSGPPAHKNKLFHTQYVLNIIL